MCLWTSDSSCMRVSLCALTALLLLSTCSPAPADGQATDEGEGEQQGVPAEDFGFLFVINEPELGFAQAGAIFRRDLPRAFDCQETAIAGCVLLTCAGDPLPFAPVSAGDVSIAGALVPVELSFANNDGYGDVFLEGQDLFTGGETLTATGAGDAQGVPLFDLAVTAPHVVTIEEPVWPAGADALAIERARGLAVSWSGTGDGDVRAVVTTLDLSSEVSCVFPSAPGSANIPAEALQALPAGDGFLDIEVRSTDDVRIDTWLIQLSASSHALANQGAAIASVNLQ